MTKFNKYRNKVENQEFKEFTKYLDEQELINLEFHFNNYAKQLILSGVVKSLPNKYCPQCGEPIKKPHKFWCEAKP